MSLTLERLKEVLIYDSAEGIFTWLDRSDAKDAWRVRCVGRRAGSLMKIGYWSIPIDNKRYLAHRLAWLYVHGAWPDSQIDHINGCRADNRIENLRAATNTQNSCNRGLNKNNTTGLKGVRWYPRDANFRAYIKIGGKQRHLGSFEDPLAAASAYQEAALRAHGEFFRS